jgi:methionyl-tRNA formyltransferase
VDAPPPDPAVNVVLVAGESAGVRALQLLVERGENVLAVLAESAPEWGASVAKLAAELEVPRFEPERVQDPEFADWIAEQEVDLLLNVHSLRIAAGAVLAAPGIGSFNLHPGPLPRYAGLNSPSWAIAEGEQRHAVTVHWMTAEVDAGAIAYEQWMDIEPNDTGIKLATRCVGAGIPLLAQLLDDARLSSIPARPQTGARRWYGREVPHGGRLPWQLGARRVVDLVRAADYAPFPSPWGTFATRVGGDEVAIARASRTSEPTDAPPGSIGSARETGVPVSAGDEWVLVERVRRGGEIAKPADALPEGILCELPDLPSDAARPA